MAAVRYPWMFRTAAVVCLLFGGLLLWRYGFTGYEPQFRPFGLIAGALLLVVGVLLLRGARIAIGVSALFAGFICLCATLAAPSARGPVILFFAALALVCGIYAVLAARVLFARGPPET